MPENTSPPARDPNGTPDGERIAKLLSRRGVASRREAERLIEAGEVTVNGKVITSPALNVTGTERITISGRLLPEEEEARLWLYYKPEGLVTSASDEKGRDTVFDHLPEDMPRVMSVGRLDLNSEGLLLLTNDGGLKRRLELPSTGWLRKYRVRVNGQADDLKLQILRDGITIEGERFKPMQVTIDRQQGANAWLTVGLREGKNREIRRAMNAIDLYVNRLIRVSYGPFRLGSLEPGQVEEVKARVLRDQLGEIAADEAAAEAIRKRPALTRVRAGKPAPARPAAGKPERAGAERASPAARPVRSASAVRTASADRPANATRSAFPATERGARTASRATTGAASTDAAGKPATAKKKSGLTAREYFTHRAEAAGRKDSEGSGGSSYQPKPPARSTGDAARPVRAPGMTNRRPASAGADPVSDRSAPRKPRAPKLVSTRNAPATTGARPSRSPAKPGGPTRPGTPSGRGGPGRKG
ncbi:pseudouridine synthase [Rhodobacter sp. 24-YEA-8]|uniref:pseudouridine synthase n=1 Tax=Rhodobacter sp. 24-YEA-8 TaxID=1884310 RepID=UPI0008979E64|nr:pseudouridine synthase [Rhodobacter sp. 24-YEA-8]SEB71116.1 23S rRNA pseudouridine2605 synthase [Rhodobacter sp. 24-YEA-8]